MDSQGFVFLSLVANFKRVKQLTTDLELIKYVCYQSPNIEWRVGSDGKDRLRRREGWQQWVLPVEERDGSVQNEGPANITMPPTPVPQGFEHQMQARHSVATMPQTALPTTAPWSVANGTGAAYGMMSPTEAQNGQQIQQIQAQTMMLNGYEGGQGFAVGQQGMAGSPPPADPEADSFSDEQAENLTVIVRKGDQPGAPPVAPRTFSNGSIDGRNPDDSRNIVRQDSGSVPTGNVSFRG
jgi:la-related protein 1